MHAAVDASDAVARAFLEDVDVMVEPEPAWDARQVQTAPPRDDAAPDPFAYEPLEHTERAPGFACTARFDDVPPRLVATLLPHVDALSDTTRSGAEGTTRYAYVTKRSGKRWCVQKSFHASERTPRQLAVVKDPKVGALLAAVALCDPELRTMAALGAWWKRVSTSDDAAADWVRRQRAPLALRPKVHWRRVRPHGGHDKRVSR